MVRADTSGILWFSQPPTSWDDAQFVWKGSSSPFLVTMGLCAWQLRTWAKYQEEKGERLQSSGNWSKSKEKGGVWERRRKQNGRGWQQRFGGWKQVKSFWEWHQPWSWMGWRSFVKGGHHPLLKAEARCGISNCGVQTARKYWGSHCSFHEGCTMARVVFLCHSAAYFGALRCKSGPVNKWIKQWENTIHHWESMLMYQHCVHKRRLWIQIKSVWNFLSEILQQLKSNLSQPHDQIKSSLHNAYTKSNQNLGSSDFGAWNFVRKFDWYITKDWNKWMPWWVHLLLLPNTGMNWYVCV